MKDFFIGCGMVLLIIAVFAIFEGWIFMLLWNWLVPLFWETAPNLTIWQSIGILFLINIFAKLIFSSK